MVSKKKLIQLNYYEYQQCLSEHLTELDCLRLEMRHSAYIVARHRQRSR